MLRGRISFRDSLPESLCRGRALRSSARPSAAANLVLAANGCQWLAMAAGGGHPRSGAMAGPLPTWRRDDTQPRRPDPARLGGSHPLPPPTVSETRPQLYGRPRQALMASGEARCGGGMGHPAAAWGLEQVRPGRKVRL